MLHALIDTRTLRRALAAVAPHVLKPSNPLAGGDLVLMRWTFTPHLMWVQASTGATTAMAAVNVSNVEGLTGDPYEDSFEISVSSAEAILATFRAHRDQEMESDLDVVVRDDRLGRWVDLEDVSGLIPGQKLTIPRAERPDHFPNLPRVTSDRLDARPIQAVDPESGPVGKIRAQGLVELLKRFSAAEKIYGQPALVQATQGHRAFLVTVADAFIGMVITYQEDDGEPAAWHANITAHQNALLAQLGPLGMALDHSNERRNQPPTRLHA